MEADKRYRQFDCELDEATTTAVHGVVREARITLLEYFLLEGCKLWFIPNSQGDAVAEIKKQTKSMTLVKPQLLPCDIHPRLWNACQNILSNQAPE